jgi:hypothetical protein
MNNESIKIKSDFQPLKYPALFIRKIRHCDDETVTNLMKSYRPKYVRFVRRTSDVNADLAIAYFDSEEMALTTCKTLQGAKLNGKRISVRYR